MKAVPTAVVRFCAEECDRQQTGPLEVFNMVRAWETLDEFETLTDRRLMLLAERVEPLKNFWVTWDEKDNYRQVPVTFADGGSAAPHEEIPRLVTQLLYALNVEHVLTPLDFYTELEKIHPWVDGNGRVGALLYNWLNKTMYKPVAPPNVFG